VSAVRDTAAMIAGMTPVLDPDPWVFCTTDGAAPPEALATFVEAEGMSLILPLAAAQRMGFDTALPMRRITLMVHSALDGVGLTAAVAGALARAGIPCNMVAAFHHDHAFVPEGRADEALDLLCRLSAAARAPA